MDRSYPYPIVQAYTDDGRRVPLPCAHVPVHCYNTYDPRHIAYGQVMINTWRQFNAVAGMLWIEGDIALEPLHLDEIAHTVDLIPGCVVTAPFRLYPASTHHYHVQWPFYVETNNGGERILRADEPIPTVVRSFGLGCTYLPAELLATKDMDICKYDWPSLDWKLSILARESGIPIFTTHTPVVHLHY